MARGFPKSWDFYYLPPDICRQGPSLKAFAATPSGNGYKCRLMTPLAGLRHVYGDRSRTTDGDRPAKKIHVRALENTEVED